MPSYKTHAMFVDKTNKFVDKRINLDLNNLKVFSFGPDSLVFTDPILFNTQHNKYTKNFFESLLQKIKEEKEQDNDVLISFLYGQISHYILDYSFHPYIFYISNGLKTSRLINSHMQIELWLDSYIMNKYKMSDDKYFVPKSIHNSATRRIINEVYYKIYKSYFTSSKYDIGINMTSLIETNLRKNKSAEDIARCLNIGDFKYYKDKSCALFFLNLARERWSNPVSGEKHNESVDELWNNAVSDYLETIDAINKFLYDGEPLKETTINSDLSYDTSLPCESSKKMIYQKKY